MNGHSFGFCHVEIETVYAYFEEPLVFLGRTKTGSRYLFIALDETEDGERWFALPVSHRRIRELEAHTYTLRHAVLNAEEGWLWHLNVMQEGICERTVITPDHVPSDDLPEDDSWITSAPISHND